VAVRVEEAVDVEENEGEVVAVGGNMAE